MREKLIELLNRWPCFGTAEEHADHIIANGVTVQDNTEISDEFVKMLKTAPVTILQEEPTIETVQEWISVKDRLPEQTDPATAVLGITKRGKCYVVYYYKAAINNEFTGFYDNAVKRDITHWMPLPQPPKGD